MGDTKNPQQPAGLEYFGENLVKFRLRNLFISDNQHLFIAPQDGFCKTCFLRRHQSLFDRTRIVKISEHTLLLARILDGKFNEKLLWRWFLIEGEKAGKPFELIPYEDCTECGKEVPHECGEAAAQYHNLLNLNTTPRLDMLRNQVFSFGFARGLMSDNQIAAMNPTYKRLEAVLDQILGNNQHSRIIYRIITSDGRYTDDTSTGFSTDKTLAELKAIMEYLERYAFLLQTCRFKTNEFDEQIIEDYLSLYDGIITEGEQNHIRSRACWGINLCTEETRAIPLPFIFNNGGIRLIQPTSSGFAAHIDFKKSLCSSILELVERDAFLRFWYDPQRAYNFAPDEDVKSAIDGIMAALRIVLDNDSLVSKYFIVQSPTRLPVVMAAIFSEEFCKPPALCFGCGAGYDVREALLGALKELRINASNLVKAVSFYSGYLQRKFTTIVESVQDRMNLYSTSTPREKLRFLDSENPLYEGIVENAQRDGLNTIVERFSQAGFDIYCLDFTPICFQDKNVFVTRAFSPQLYPLQFHQENVFNLPVGPMSVHNELPHFFL